MSHSIKLYSFKNCLRTTSVHNKNITTVADFLYV